MSRIGRSMFLTGFLLCGLLLLCNLWLTPLGIQETEYIKDVKIKKKTKIAASESKDIYFRNGNSIVHISRSFPQRGVLLGVTIVTLDDRFQPVERLQAVSGHYQGNGLWALEEVKIWQLSVEEKTIQGYEEKAEWQLALGKEPSQITQLWSNPEEMTQAELYRLIRTLQADGHDSRTFQLESHLRLSKGFIPLIMVLLGMPFALQRGRRPSFARGIIISLAVFVVYFVLYAVFAALGSSAILSPVVAAWAANILMTLTATWLFLKAQD
jgi:lipopolysaccharide export system permease protein